MPRRLPGILAAVILGFSGLLLSPAPHALAQDGGCGVIVDNANVVDDGKLQPVINDLIRVGADPHIVTANNLGHHPTLDALVDAQWKSCPNWKATNGGRKSNLVVFAISIQDRQVGIFPTDGEPIDRAFEDAGGEQTIYSQYMGPKLRDGDFTAAFVAGMDRASDVISGAGRPQGGDVTNVDFGGVGKVIGWIFGLLILLGAIFAAIWYRRRILAERRTAAEALEAMRQRALRARDATTDILQALRDGQGETLRRARVVKYASIGGQQATELQEALATVTREIAAASDAMTGAASASANPDDTGLTQAVYEAMAQRYEGALQHAKTARDADQRITEIAKAIESELQQVTTALAEAEARLQNQQAAVEQLRAENIRVEIFDSQLETVIEHLAAAMADQGNLAALGALHRCNEALASNETALRELTERRAQLAQAIPALEARIAEVRASLDAAHQCFERISTAYAPDCWESIAGNGTEATTRINGADQALATAGRLSDISTQQWDAAAEAISAGNHLLDEAAGLLHSITALEQNLQRAQQQAQPEIDAAQADIDRAAAYIQQHDDDIRDSLEDDDLAQARATLEAACAEFAESQPNYLRVVELALAANAHADRILQQAMDEHESAERLRHQAATALSQAQAAVSKAAEYISDHRSDVGSAAESNLQNARRHLGTAQHHNDPANILRAAQSAKREADEAYRKAKRNFQDAEDERERARQRRSTSHNSSYGGGTSFSYTNIDFGGGSSWGSGGGGFDFGGSQGGSSGSWGGDSGGSQGGSSGSW